MTLAQSSFVDDERRARDFECPACGAWPPVSILHEPYDCNGQTLGGTYVGRFRHDWTRPRRLPLTATAFPGHEAPVPFSLAFQWMRDRQRAARS